MLKKVIFALLSLVCFVTPAFAQGAAIAISYRAFKTAEVKPAAQSPASQINASVQSGTPQPAAKKSLNLFVAARIRTNQEFLYSELSGAQFSLQIVRQKPAGGLLYAVNVFKNLQQDTPVDRVDLQVGYDVRLVDRSFGGQTRALILSPRLIGELFFKGLKVIDPQVAFYYIVSDAKASTVIGLIAEGPVANQSKTNGPRVIGTLNQTRKLGKNINVFGEIQLAAGALGFNLVKSRAIRGLAGINLRTPIGYTFGLAVSGTKAKHYNQTGGVTASITKTF